MTLAEIFNIKGLFDSHAHLAYSSETEVALMIKNAKTANLQAVCNMGIDIPSSQKVIAQSKSSNKYIQTFVGIDPEVFEPGSELFVGFENGEIFIEEQMALLLNLIYENIEFVTGIGEAGMDYYHFEQTQTSVSDKEFSKTLQQKLFIKHLELADEFKLPLSIHSRWAEKDCLTIIKSYVSRGIFHSYTGDLETAKKVLDNGWGLGVNGIITFKNADNLRGLYRKIIGKVSEDWSPLDFYNKGIFFETDTPFLSPNGKRGQTNEPANVSVIFDFFINYLK